MDKRYTIFKEFCGHEKQLYVLRFCCEFLGSFKTRKEALTEMQKHEKKRHENLNAIIA